MIRHVLSRHAGRWTAVQAVAIVATVAAVAAVAAIAPATAIAEPAAAREPHAFSVHDMLAMLRISDPQVSPDGKLVVFAVRETDLEANRGRTDLWLADTAGRNPARPLTRSEAGEWNPRWSNDGKIHFLSNRSGGAQIWVIDPLGGEASQLSATPLDIAAFEHAPALGGYLVAMEVYPGLSPAATAARDTELAADKRSGLAYDELLFRHWDTWEDGKRSHLFILRPDGSHVDLMPELDADVPTRPWGGMEEVAVAPGGGEVLFTAKILPGSEPAWSTDYNVYAVATDGSGRIRNLTADNPAWDTGPVFSPDGKTVAWLAMQRPGFEADRFRVELRSWPDLGQPRRLELAYDGLDLSPGDLLWDPAGRTLYVTAPYLGQRSVFAIDVRRGTTRLVVRDGSNGAVAWAGDRLLYLKQHLRSPNEIYTARPDGRDERRLTGLNDANLAACRMGEPEQFTFQGWDDHTVYAYVVKPYDWSEEAVRAGRTWPVAFLVHGGPQGSFGNDFHYRWNPQAYVGAGFTTLAVDFHGSVGYGQAFTDAISGHWGDRPLEDLEKGLAAALARYPWMNGDHVVAAGASYGGYMINWMHGQPFGRKFRAFVTHDGNLDEQMAYFDTEELWFPEWEHGGTPWENPAGYQKHNPINHVQNWHVPTLVIHGQLDYRVVYTQGLSTFTALRRQNVPARLLFFPDENHWILKPHNSIQWHEEVMAWLTRWTRD
ncbi:MAG: S9 family peptidase [Candidatus Krumholzibacteria bacterium]|nr:S9 family peptidase [Candidatus Krumholzibacteria bacterium]